MITVTVPGVGASSGRDVVVSNEDAKDASYADSDGDSNDNDRDGVAGTIFHWKHRPACDQLGFNKEYSKKNSMTRVGAKRKGHEDRP